MLFWYQCDNFFSQTFFFSLRSFFFACNKDPILAPNRCSMWLSELYWILGHIHRISQYDIVYADTERKQGGCSVSKCTAYTHFITSQFVLWTVVPWFALLCPRLIGRAPTSLYVLNLVPSSLSALKINNQLITPAVSLMRGRFWSAS